MDEFEEFDEVEKEDDELEWEEFDLDD